MQDWAFWEVQGRFADDFVDSGQISLPEVCYDLRRECPGTCLGG
jgi:hypothetical protein